MSNGYKLSKKQTIAWELLEDSKTKEVLYGGAAGGGKSLLGCVWQVYRRTTYPGTRGLIGRSVLKNLKESTLVTLFDVLKVMGYERGVDWQYKEQTARIIFNNSSVIVLKDLYLYPSDPDFASLGSTEYTDAFIDESTEISLKAFDIVKSRIRYKHQEYGLTPTIYLTGNPAPGWVKERFVRTKEGRDVELKEHQAYVAANVFDNPDPEFVKLYSELLSEMSSDYDKARLLDGDWDVEREVKSPFLTQYNESKHVGKDLFNPMAQTYVLIDFNLDPFSASVFQSWYDGTPHDRQVAEIEIKGGTTSEMANRIKHILGDAIYTAQFGGDYNGNQGRIGKHDNISLHKDLQNELGVAWRQFKLVPNPKHKTSANDCNYYLVNYPDFQVGESCINSRRDYRTVQIDAYGSIIKRNRKDDSQKADHLDNFRYFINTFRKKQIEQHKRSGIWI